MPKYMVMQSYTGPEGVEPLPTWTPEDIEAHIEFQHELNAELTEAGELVDAQGLAGPEQAKFVTCRRRDGAPVVTDGPFAEAKELLAGYRMVDVESRGARHRDRGAGLGRARAGRRAAAAADRGAPGDGRARPERDRVTATATGIEDLLRELAPQVLGALVRRYGDFDAAEDAVQEALLAAATQWPAEGVPDNPRGWLIQVAVAAADRPVPQRGRPGGAGRSASPRCATVAPAAEPVPAGTTR